MLLELAQLADQRALESNPWRRLSDASKEEGVAMLGAGIRPGLGWWRRHLPRPDIDLASLPPLPSVELLTRPWEPWQLIAAAITMADQDWPPEDAVDTLAQLAANHHLDAGDALDALVAYKDR